MDRLKVLILSQQKEKSSVLALLGNGISVDLEVPGRRRTPDASLVVALNRGGIKEALQHLEALQNQRIEGRLAVFWCQAGSKVWGRKPARAMERSLDTHKAKYWGFQILHNLPSRSFDLFTDLSPEQTCSESGVKMFSFGVPRSKSLGVYHAHGSQSHAQWLLI